MLCRLKERLREQRHAVPLKELLHAQDDDVPEAFAIVQR